MRLPCLGNMPRVPSARRRRFPLVVSWSRCVSPSLLCCFVGFTAQESLFGGFLAALRVVVCVVVVRRANRGAVVDVVNQVRSLGALADVVRVHLLPAAPAALFRAWVDPATLASVALEHRVAPLVVLRAAPGAFHPRACRLGAGARSRAHRCAAHWLVARFGFLKCFSETHPKTMLSCVALKSIEPCRDCLSRRSVATSQNFSSISIPIPRRPSAFAATRVVPLPANGSRITSSGSLNRKTSSRINPIGFGQGWSGRSFFTVPCVHVAA